jgi:hypothetical protein
MAASVRCARGCQLGDLVVGQGDLSRADVLLEV